MPETVKTVLGLFKLNQRVITHYLDGSGVSRNKAEDVRDDDQLFDMAEMHSDYGSERLDSARPSCRILVETLLLAYVTTTG